MSLHIVLVVGSISHLSAIVRGLAMADKHPPISLDSGDMGSTRGVVVDGSRRRRGSLVP